MRGAWPAYTGPLQTPGQTPDRSGQDRVYIPLSSCPPRNGPDKTTNFAKILSMKSMVDLDTSGQNDELPGQRACPEALTQTGPEMAFWGIVCGGGRIPHPTPTALNST